MAITLGTNLPSIRSQGELNRVTFDLSDVMQRISTGLKINKAADDAAGLVISQNMEAVIRSSDQASANIQTASSFLKVAEDGMVSISDHYQRINDLLENMANDTNDVTSRTASIDEIIERLKEINRLADSTNFNGRKMLAGDKQSIVIQIGTTPDDISTLDISSALSNCHTSADLGMGTDIPYFLVPGAKIKTEPAPGTSYNEVDYIKPNPNGTGYVDKDGNPVADPSAYTIDAFNPNNANCRKYMGKIQEAISDLSSKRGLIGAYENRMDSAYDSLNSRIESLKDAKGVYTDTDIAKEATNLVNKQILQQLNISMLTMANNIQQNALALLGG